MFVFAPCGLKSCCDFSLFDLRRHRRIFLLLKHQERDIAIFFQRARFFSSIYTRCRNINNMQTTSYGCDLIKCNYLHKRNYIIKKFK